jgi:sterol desaturase/sphingolipid hydroxylase (fatty acid hydroxylase superfamily)
MPVNYVKAIVEILALSIVFSLEGIFPLFEGRKERLSHAFKNIFIGMINVVLISLAFSSVTVWTMHWSQGNHFGLLNHFNLNPAVAFIIAFVLFDLWMYLWHVANHRVRFFWRFHRMHHSDLELDSTSALRFHPGEMVLSSLVRLLILPLLGLEWMHLIGYEICLQPIIIFHHSNVALTERWDRIFRSLIVTPNMHRVHHSQVLDETNSNYASVFSVWDRLMRTFRKRENTKTLNYGLPEFPEKKWQTFLGMLRIPFVS